MIRVYRYNKEAKLPTRNKSLDAGLDLYSLETKFIEKGQTVTIDTGIAVEIPEGYYGKLFTRSSMAKNGLVVLGGVIDSGFVGNLTVIVHNLSNESSLNTLPGLNGGYFVEKGDRIAQLVIQPCLLTDCIETTELWHSERGDNGFGSSGK